MSADDKPANDLISAARKAAQRARDHRKKTEERNDLEDFLAFAGLDPAKIEEREGPDFILEFPWGLRAALELQRLRDAGLSKTQNQIDRSVVRWLIDELAERRVILDVQLYWLDSFRGFAENPKRINLVREAILADLVRVSPEASHQWQTIQRPEPLPVPELRGFSFRKNPDLPGTKIECIAAYDGAGREVVDAAIRNKERKLETYRKCRADEFWLLLVTGGPKQPVSYELVYREQFKSQFDRVDLIDVSTARWTRIRT